MLRKFRFSLLGLLIFFAIVAVVLKYWLSPYLLVLPTAESVERFGNFAESTCHFINDMVDKSTTAEFIVVRDPIWLRLHRGPVIYRFGGETFVLFDRGEKEMANVAHEEILTRSPPADVKFSGPIERITTLIADVSGGANSSGRQSEPASGELFVTTDRGNRYIIYPDDEHHLITLVLIKNDADFAQKSLSRSKPSDRLKKVLLEEAERVRKK